MFPFLETIFSSPAYVVAILLGTALLWFRKSIQTKFVKHLTTTVTLGVGPYYNSTEQSMMVSLTLEVLDYINKLNNNKFQHWVVKYRTNEYESNLTEAVWRWKIEACPGILHLEWFTYKNKYFYVYNEMIDTESNIITIGTFRWNRLQLHELIEEARKNQQNLLSGRMSFYRTKSGEWDWFSYKDWRPFDSVIMKKGLKEQLLKDLKTFLTSRKWYTDLGIPYHRGYLLHGPPGTGKSSLIRAIASEIKYSICLLNLTSEGLDDDTINLYMNSIPNKCLLLLEDIDVAFKSRDLEYEEGSTIAHGSKLTLKGLLNALDGVSSADGRIIFVTTNYLDKLDAALIRPGRIDLKLLIDNPTDEQICNLFQKFYPEAKEEQKLELLNSVKNIKEKVSMASLQNLFIEYRNNIDEVLEKAETYLNSTLTEKNNNTMSIYN